VMARLPEPDRIPAAAIPSYGACGGSDSVGPSGRKLTRESERVKEGSCA